MTASPFTVRLDAASKNLLSLLASSESETLEEYAQAVLRSHARDAASDDAIMATLGRALLAGRATPPDKPERGSQKKKATEADGLPVGVLRASTGEIMPTRELRSMSYSAIEVSKLLGISQNLIMRCVEERGVVPFGFVANNPRMPRFREEEVSHINTWLSTSCDKGAAPRNRQCQKCLRYFSGQGLRMHERVCPGPYKG